MRTPAALSLAVSLLCFSTDLAPQGPAPQVVLPGGQSPRVPPAPGGPGAPLPPRDQVQPPAQTGTAAIRGRVVGADTGEPLRRVQIRASAAEMRQGRLTITDEQGRFELKELPAGRYTLTATKGGFVTLSYGQRRPQEAGRPIQLSEGQVIEKVDFNLPRGSVITGRVVDEFGEAVTGAMIQVTRYQFVAGQRRLAPVFPVFMNGTDDLGQFRVFGLSPGDYYISASLRSNTSPMELSNDRTGYAPTYYPGTLSITDAQPVAVGLAEEVAGITFPLVPSRTATISGIVLNSEGKPFSSATVALRQNFGAADGTMGVVTFAGMTQPSPDGSFTMSGVIPGEYMLDARSMNPMLPDSEVGSVQLNVAGDDIKGILIVTTKGTTARGRITFDGASAPPKIAPETVRLFGNPANPSLAGPGSVGRSTVHEDWTFEIAGLTGQRRINVAPPPSWFVKSISHDGINILDTPVDFKSDEVTGIEIVLTQKTTDLSGTVRDSRSAAVKEYVLVLFADDRDRWGPQTRFIRLARPDQEGRFRIRGMPPERYLAVALDHLEPGEERNPEVLQQLRSIGTSVVLREGESRALDLRLASY